MMFYKKKHGKLIINENANFDKCFREILKIN